MFPILVPSQVTVRQRTTLYKLGNHPRHGDLGGAKRRDLSAVSAGTDCSAFRFVRGPFKREPVCASTHKGVRTHKRDRARTLTDTYAPLPRPTRTHAHTHTPH